MILQSITNNCNMTGTVLNIDRSDIEQLEKLYNFDDRNSEEVLQFIENHSL